MIHDFLMRAFKQIRRVAIMIHDFSMRASALLFRLFLIEHNDIRSIHFRSMINDLPIY